MSSVNFIYNTRGEYVAYLKGNDVFTPPNHWYGFVRQENLVYDKTGSFVGYIRDHSRIVRKINELPRPRRSPPIEPILPLAPIPPPYRMQSVRLPYPYEDVFQ